MSSKLNKEEIQKEVEENYRASKKQKKAKKHKKKYSSSESSDLERETKSSRRRGKRKKRNRASSTSSESDDARRQSTREKKHKKREYTSSSSSESEEEKFVKYKRRRSSFEETNRAHNSDWKDINDLVPTYERKKERSSSKIENKCIIEAPGQSDRELNPYWKDGGCGLPMTEKQSTSTFGDKGLEWYERALKRSLEIAKEENRTLEDVVKERWGSLEELKSLIANAKSKRDGASHKRENFQPRSRPAFKKPGEESYGESHRREGTSSGKSSWRKIQQKEKEAVKESIDASLSQDTSKCKSDNIAVSENDSQDKSATILSDDEINALAAKLVKAEIMGKTDLVEKLKRKLADARAARDASTSDKGANAETVVLLHSNSRGMTHPVKQPKHMEPKGGRRGDKRTETHSKGQRDRYFHDDDQRDLKEMFEREKLNTGDDENALYLKMAKFRSGRGSDEEDAAFADAARVAEADGKKQQREKRQAEQEARHRRKRLDGCPWCVDNSNFNKKLIVAMGEKCLMCVPADESLTQLHCVLVPVEHVACGTQLDEDVWDEMHQFRRALVNMASELGDDVIFFEQARALRSHPHMVYHCVVVDKEVGETAPIYFKKALLESESEWASNKKVVDIKGADVRRSVPIGLPYFSVEFPPQGGFAHVIEDEKLFPANFAHSIIGGMMDLDHEKWRKSKKCSSAAQMVKAQFVSKHFAKHNFTKPEKKRGGSSRSSSTSSSD